jgi:hypothetical protein
MDAKKIFLSFTLIFAPHTPEAFLADLYLLADGMDVIPGGRN